MLCFIAFNVLHHSTNLGALTSGRPEEAAWHRIGRPCGNLSRATWKDQNMAKHLRPENKTARLSNLRELLCLMCLICLSSPGGF